MSDTQKRGVKGVRDLATLHTLRRGAQSCERQQLVSRLLQLENERARLEQEFALWEAKKLAAQDKLAATYRDLEALRSSLLKELSKAPASHRTDGYRRGRESKVAAGSAMPLSRNTLIEY